MMTTTLNDDSCACVHRDAYECARIRDRIEGEEDCDRSRKRACECACHKEEYDEDE